MKFDPTITLGTILTIVAIVASIVGSLYAFRTFVEVKVVEMTKTLEAHAYQLEQNASELHEQRKAYTSLLAQVQHLVGQMELLLRMQDPRRNAR